MLSQDEVLHNSSMLRSSKPFVPSTRETGQPVYIQEGLFACVFTACAALPTPGVLGKRIRAALRRIAWFYSRNFADREKGVLARARGIVKAPLPS